MRELLGRFRRRTTSRPQAVAPSRDWTNQMTPRDWADLPTYHPRSETDAP